MVKHVFDIAFAVVLFVGAIYLWFVADAFPRFARYRDIDSDFWPKALMVVIGIVALVLLLQSLQALRLTLAKRRLGLDPEGGGAGADVGWARLAFAAALTVAYVVALRYAGFLVSTIVFLSIAQNLVSYPNRWVKLVFPFAFTAIMTVLFVRVMSLSLPRGTGMFYQLSLLFY